jgi:glycosyltransferase involved in cell wall biosynthesis
MDNRKLEKIERIIMSTPVRSILRKITRQPNKPLNILTCPTHEAYEVGLAKTEHQFYAWRAEGIKNWETKYRPLPSNYHLLDPEQKGQQIPLHVDIDLVLSQNKFGQYQILHQVAQQLNLPLISLEHTLPMPNWSKAQLHNLRHMQGKVNLFISEYSREVWGWDNTNADIIHHGIDTDLFKPDDNIERRKVALSAVNDWINRDWCCGFRLWTQITGWPHKQIIPIDVIGNTPGLSLPAKTIEELISKYQTSIIFLNTSIVSPIPTSMLEAMACGCAIVSTNNCMIPEVIKHGINGFLSNDSGELRSYVIQLLRDEKLARRMGEAARKTIVDKYNLSNFINNWNEIFRRAIN